MKQSFIVMITLLISITISYGQSNNYEYGKISQEEFDLKSYPEDKDAEAVVLFDIGKSYFIQTDYGFEVVYERHTRLKVFSNAGVKWGEIVIPYYQEGNVFENITDLKGTTYNPDEVTYVKKTELNTKNSYDEELDNNWKLKKFAMPDVKSGSIIEYSYKIYSGYIFNLRDWEFQWEIPVLYSKYTVSMIPFYEYTWLLQGKNAFDEKKSYVENNEQHFAGVTYKNYVNEFVMKNVPAFNDEEFITSKNDFILKIDFQLSKISHPNGSSTNVVNTWEEMIKDLLKDNDFGKYIEKSEKLATKNPEIQKIRALPDVEEKFNAVVDYAKNNYKWNGYNSKYASKSASDFEKQKTGNSADINLYTIGLLRSVGVPVMPVVVSTREHGRIKYDYPYLHFFNDVVFFVDVNNKKIVSDATEPMCLNSLVPERCVNNKGLIVDKDKVDWLSMETSVVSNNITNISMSINNNQIDAQITKIGTEYESVKYKDMFGEDKEKIKKYFKSQIYEISDTSIKFINSKNTNKSYAFNFNVENNPEIINDKMYINPFLGLSLSENPLKKQEREYPIDMTYPRRTIFITSVSIPEGWQINFLPDNKHIENDLFALDYYITHADDGIRISFSYFFKKSVYSENHYLLIKSYFNDIVNKGNDKIVLSKK